MILKACDMETKDGRTHYPVEDIQSCVKHFVRRVTAAENPFGPHKHEEEEIWYVIGGQGVVLLDGEEIPIETGDLILLKPWKEHGIKSDSEVTWVCLA